MRHYFCLASTFQQEKAERQGVMKKSAHTQSRLIQNRKFPVRIACKECAHFNEVGRIVYYVHWSS